MKTGRLTEENFVPITIVLFRDIQICAKTSEGSTDVGEIAEGLEHIFSGNEGIVKEIANSILQCLEAIIGTGEGKENKTLMYAVLVEYSVL